MATITEFEIEFDKLMRPAHHAACEALDRRQRGALDEGNPNHPNYDLHLFGEPVNKFMARQYK